MYQVPSPSPENGSCLNTVVLYGSEILGTVNILSSKIKKADFTLEHLFENFLCDKLQIKLLKYISKIDKNAANLAVLSEFGRYSLCIKVSTNTCKFLQRLIILRKTIEGY